MVCSLWGGLRLPPVLVVGKVNLMRDFLSETTYIPEKLPIALAEWKCGRYVVRIVLEGGSVNSRAPKERHIVLAIYQGVSLLDLGGPLEAFRVASAFGHTEPPRAVQVHCRIFPRRPGGHGRRRGASDPIDPYARSR
jgi:hypothetical protein